MVRVPEEEDKEGRTPNTLQNCDRIVITLTNIVTSRSQDFSKVTQKKKKNVQRKLELRASQLNYGKVETKAYTTHRAERGLTWMRTKVGTKACFPSKSCQSVRGLLWTNKGKLILIIQPNEIAFKTVNCRLVSAKHKLRGSVTGTMTPHEGLRMVLRLRGEVNQWVETWMRTIPAGCSSVCL